MLSPGNDLATVPTGNITLDVRAAKIEAAQPGARCGHAAGSRSQRADLPPLAESVRRHEGRRSRRLKKLKDDNRQLEELVAKLTLDNHML
jgi:hypothetical protein